MAKLRLDHPASRKGRRFASLVALAIVLAVSAGTPRTAIPDVVADMGVFVGYAPPPLPLDEQPPIPGPGYIWVPGYWAWGDDGYYWVPGFWVLPPFEGALWTPAYWGWFGSVCVFHRGFWARHVGFYGGINYGYGYPGHGYVGGHWGPGGFYYNRSVNRINDPRITNVYDGPVPHNGVVGRTSFNGGQGGVMARPSAQDLAVAREARVGPEAAQIQQLTMARQDPSMRASFNHGALLAAARASAPDGLSAGVTRGVVRQATPMAVNSQRTLPPVQIFHRGTVLRSASFVPHPSGATSHGRTFPTYTYHPSNGRVAYRRAAALPAPANHAAHAAVGGHVNGGGGRR